MKISYKDETYGGLPFYSLIESGDFDLECTYNQDYEPQHFFINRRLVTQEDILADLFWDYDVERIRNEIRDFDLDKAFGLVSESHTFGNTGCVKKFKG